MLDKITTTPVPVKRTPDILDPFIHIVPMKVDYPFCPPAPLMDPMAHGMVVILMLQAMRPMSNH